jgi:hypothetical protein
MRRKPKDIAPVIAVIFALTGCAGLQRADVSAYQAEIRVSAEGIKEFRASTLDESGPFPILTLRGDPRERGIAYGVLMADRLKDMSGKAASLSAGQTRFLPFYKKIFAGAYVSWFMADFERRTPPGYVEEMRGLAEGSGAPYGTVRMGCSSLGTISGCTSVLAEKSGNGILHGRNFDFQPYFMGEYPVIVRYEGQGEIGYWNIGMVGYLPSFNGANDAGISISLNLASGENPGPRGVPMGWRVREILAHASCLDDVRRIVRGTPNDSRNWILTAASAREGKGFVFDLKDGVQAETASDPGSPRIVLNRCFGDDRHVNDGLAQEHLDFVEKNIDTNTRRWDSARLFLESRGIADMADVWSLLRNHDYPVAETFGTRGTIVNSSTMYSMVFDLAADEITLAVGTSYSALRDVWRLNLEKRRFSLFLPEDGFVQTEGFKRREDVYLRLSDAYFGGTIELDMLSDLEAHDIDPYLLNAFGDKLGYLDDPRMADLIRRHAELFPDDWYSAACYGLSLMDRDVDKGLAALEDALAMPGIDDFGRLITLTYLSDVSAKRGKKAIAVDAAARWLALGARMAQGCSAAGWYASTRKRMEKRARNLP